MVKNLSWEMGDIFAETHVSKALRLANNFEFLNGTKLLVLHTCGAV